MIMIGQTPLMVGMMPRAIIVMTRSITNAACQRMSKSIAAMMGVIIADAAMGQRGLLWVRSQAAY